MNTLDAMDVEMLIEIVKGSELRADLSVILQEKLRMELSAILTREQLLGTYESHGGHY